MSNNLRGRVSFGLFVFDHETGELRREGSAVKLAPQPSRVLALLLSRPGEVISRDEFRRELWGEDTFVDFERGLNFCITQVRTALSDSSENPRFVQTVPRRGYRFIAPVFITSPTPGSSASSPGLSPTEGTVPGPFPFPWRRGVAAAALVAGVAVGWLIWTTRAAPAAQDDPAPTRLVVLPFVNLTGDSAADSIADGLTDDVITQLGTLTRERLSVVARTSSMAYRHTQKSVADIGRELDVQYVVEGSLRKDGHALRFNGSLVAVDEQSAIARWEDVFDSTAAARHDTRASIRIARQAAGPLLQGIATADVERATEHSDAWHAYLQGSAAMNRGTPNDVREAIRLLNESVSTDAAFAAAWAKLAEAQHLLVMMGAASPLDAYPTAARAATHALTARPDLPGAHLAQGLVDLWYHWRPDRAARSFERAIALNPSDAASHHDYAWSLVALGRVDDAVRHITLARDLDPLSTRANNDIGWLYLHVRRPEEAARACEHTLALDARSLEAQACLERAYADRELFDAALHAARATLRDPQQAAVPVDGTAESQLHHIWAWRRDQLARASQTRWINPYTLAVHYTLTGQHRQALDALDAAFAARVGMLVFVARDPVMDALRGEPRFEALLRRITTSSP